MTDAARPRPGRLAGVFTLRRLVISLLLAVAGGLIVLAFQEAADPEATVHVRPAGVLRVFPGEGDQVLRQERIGAQLADGLTGELEIDGLLIPLDQLVRPQDPISTDRAIGAPAKGLGGLNEISFTPGEGKEIERLQPGTHRARILFWDRLTSSRDKAGDYRWQFSVT